MERRLNEDLPMNGDDPLDLWHGRADPDGESGRRWHEIVRPFAEHPQAQVVILGFASDEGVCRNHGRPGAVAGPAALRRAASTLPAWPGLPPRRPPRSRDCGR